MILEFEVKNPSKTHIKWMESVVPKPKKFVFSPGLNILVGPNGSGKSTIISAISSVLQCQQGGVQKVTRMSVLDLFQDCRPDDLMESVALLHDGSPVVSCNAEQAVGLLGGSFDDDFFEEGLAEIAARCSSGQKVKGRLVRAFSVMAGKSAAPLPKWTFDPSSFMEKKTECVKHFLSGNAEQSGRIAVLLDEPDLNMDAISQMNVWSFIRKAAKNFQVIASSHSVFAFGLEDAAYHEMLPGYANQVSSVFSPEKISAYRKACP